MTREVRLEDRHSDADIEHLLLANPARLLTVEGL